MNLYIMKVIHQYYENDTIQTVATLEYEKAECLSDAIKIIDESDNAINTKVISCQLLDVKDKDYNMTEKRFNKYNATCQQ